MQLRHRALGDATAEPVAHDQVVPFPYLAHEGRNRGPVIRVIGVRHDDDVTRRFADTPEERGAVTLARLEHHSRAEPPRDLDRTIGRAVVGHHHFAVDTELGETALRFLDADG